MYSVYKSNEKRQGEIIGENTFKRWRKGRLPDVVLHCQRAGNKDNVKDGNEAELRRTAIADRKEIYKNFCAFFWRILYFSKLSMLSHQVP